MDVNMIKDIKEKYNKVYLVTATVVDTENENDCDEKQLEFVFKQPGPLDYDRFIKDSGKKPSTAFKNLVVSNIIDEQRAELKEVLEKYPAMASTLTSELLKLMGLSSEVNIKKL